MYVHIYMQIYVYVCVYIYMNICEHYVNSGHSYFTLLRSYVDFSWRRDTDGDRRCGRKFWTLYIFHWIKLFLKLPFAVSFSVLFITIQYAVFR